MCGIIGIVGRRGRHVNQLLYDGLTVLQHRGQDAAGMMTLDDGRLRLHKSNGLLRDVISSQAMQSLLGHVGIGHVRYPTAGSSSPDLAQPFYVNSPLGLGLAHNGNLTNATDLARAMVTEHLRHVNTDSDSELLLNLFARALQDRLKLVRIEEEVHLDVKDIFSAIRTVIASARGGYACIGLVAGFGMFAFRDPFGIRPLILGSRVTDGYQEWVVASESVALTALGFDIVRDVRPGEGIFISDSGHMFESMCAEEVDHAPCIFEHVYFARPDSVIDGISVYQARLNMGGMLAERIASTWDGERIDSVIPIPDSGRIAALELARKLGVPYREGFVKNRYIGRTFIMPGQAIRTRSVRRKLNAIPHEFEGKNVLLVDDSIVRGTTSAQIVEMAKEVGAAKVFFASAAPPVRHPNVYGIDMPSVEEFIANGRTVEEIRAHIGADRLIYQRLEDLLEAVRSERSSISTFDCSCFDGVYVTGDVDASYLLELAASRTEASKSLGELGGP